MNTAEMRAAIARAGKTYRGLAKSLGISEQAFYNKLNGESDFKASEIKVLRGELNLTSEEINYIFFNDACIKFTNSARQKGGTAWISKST